MSVFFLFPFPPPPCHFLSLLCPLLSNKLHMCFQQPSRGGEPAIHLLVSPVPFTPTHTATTALARCFQWPSEKICWQKDLPIHRAKVPRLEAI